MGAVKCKGSDGTVKYKDIVGTVKCKDSDRNVKYKDGESLVSVKYKSSEGL